MPLIVMGETNIISKSKMNELSAKLSDDRADPIETLPDHKKALREDVKAAKRHREFQDRVRQNEEINEQKRNAVVKAEPVAELVVEVTPVVSPVQEKIIAPVVKTTPVAEPGTTDFDSMTKSQIGIWAEENLGVTLDLRKTKYALIDEIKQS